MAVAGGPVESVGMLPNSGAKNIDRKLNRAIQSAVSPVRPPS